MKKNWLFYLILIITFLAGGAIQLFDIASNSLITIAVTILVLSHMVFTVFVKRRAIKLKLLPFTLLLLPIILSSLYNLVGFSLSALYTWMFVVVPFSIYYLVKSYLPRLEYKKLINFLLFVAVLQLPFILIETTFYSSLVQLTSRRIAKVDFSFGTFFLANDHAMGFLMLCILTLLLFTEYKPPYLSKFFYLIWLSATVIICDSKISFILLGFIIAIYVSTHLTTKMIVSFGLLVLSLPIILLVIPDSFNYVQEKTSYIIRKISPDENVEQYSLERAIELGKAERSQIFSYYIEKPLKLIGEGPYNYWNPITKQFSLFPNYSQVLWFYNDIGIFSLLALGFFYCYFFFKNNPKISYKLVFLILVLVYTYFTNTLTDLAFNLIFFIFILAHNKNTKVKINRPQHELSLHPIP